MSTLLHPSMKNLDIALNEKIKASNIIKQELLSSVSTKSFVFSAISNAVINNKSGEINLTANVSSKDLLARYFDNRPQVIKSIPIPLKELNDYIMSDITISKNDNILTFRRNNEQRCPTLSIIVHKLFAIPALQVLSWNGYFQQLRMSRRIKGKD